jgi:transcriptional regulator with XRE-family HTH domain
MTVEQVAEQLLCSPSKVSRMETGQRGATLRDVRDLCQIYGVTDAQADRITSLAREGKQQGWWQSHELDYYFAMYVGLEQAATTLCYYQSSIVPGLLQTVDYARAMHKAGMPEEFTPERADELIEIRLRRQQVLNREPPLRMRALIDEAVLHRMVGGPDVMSAQLDHLADVAKKLPNVTLGVIPYAAGAHPAMDNMFTILDFEVAPSVVYVEGLMGWLYIERDQEIAKYRQIFDHVQSMALDNEDTIEFIAEIRARYNQLPR